MHNQISTMRVFESREAWSGMLKLFTKRDHGEFGLLSPVPLFSHVWMGRMLNVRKMFHGSNVFPPQSLLNEPRFMLRMIDLIAFGYILLCLFSFLNVG